MIEEAILIGLAAWRLTALFSYERGPFDVFLRLRQFVGFDHDSLSGEPISWPGNTLPRVISCPWCLGLWVTPGVWAVWEYIDPAIVVVVAATAVLIAMEKWSHG
ncbi:hypothetical protein LCGC14_0936280 [marine sediment metagenome]|uniref:DUF1360 domain-containing protein n=1 Tax=marine sediment metagenome TaxID=412755 RepID=A0A0F9NR16_9ZZZZ